MEIDVLAINQTEGVALIGECKWSIHPLGESVLDHLKTKGQRLFRENRLTRMHYALFSRSGFTPTLLSKENTDEILFITTEDLTAPTDF